MVQRFSLRRQLSKVGSLGSFVCVFKGKLTTFGMASFFSGTVLSSLPPSSAKEGLREEALPFVLSSDRHKGLRLTALAAPNCVPLVLELSCLNM